MSDLHQLPLVGHDLPEIVLPPLRKAKVFKELQGWTWEHYCAKQRAYQAGVGHCSWDLAFQEAGDHLRKCR